MASETQKRFSRLKNITARTGLARSTIYDLIRKDKFPPPIHLTPRTSVWEDDAVDAWLEARMDASRKEG